MQNKQNNKSKKISHIDQKIITFVLFIFFGKAYGILYINGVLNFNFAQVLIGFLGLMWNSSSSHYNINVRSIEVNMFSITICIIVVIRILGNWWGNLRHHSLVPLPLCELGRLLLIGMFNMPPNIMNLLSSFEPSSLLDPSLVCLSSISNSSYVIYTHKLMDKKIVKDTP